VKKVVIAIIVAVVLVIAALILGVASPILLDVIRSSSQERKLQARSDFPQIAAACVALTTTVTNGSFLIHPTNNEAVPALLRSLSPNYISVRDNVVTLEFHGGFDHYGYRVQPVGTNQWTISYYTERSEKPLVTITND
jgi:hypothetical protein